MNQPQITPGQGGYLAPLQQREWKNPWMDVASSDATMAQEGIQQGQGKIESMQGQLESYQQQSGAYPSFPNSGGFGSQNPFAGTPEEQGKPSMNVPSQNSSPLPDSGSRGFNPWSLEGEANVR
jgi:hypothetical protein